MTVAELIAKLQTYDPAAPVELRDADTEWRIPVIHISQVPAAVYTPGNPPPGTVVLWGEYPEMIGTDEPHVSSVSSASS